MVILNHIRTPVTQLLKGKMFFPTKIAFSANLWTEPVPQNGGKKENESFKDPIRQVFISQSTDVFSNLALEDWLYRNHDFNHKVSINDWRIILVLLELNSNFICSSGSYLSIWKAHSN